MKKYLTILGAGFYMSLVSLLSAGNTIEGAGKDIEAAGEKIEKEAQEAKD